MPAAQNAAISSVSREAIGTASGVYNAMRQVGGAFGIAGGCLVACLLLAAVAGRGPFAAAVLLVVAIVLYDGFAKGSPGVACLAAV